MPIIFSLFVLVLIQNVATSDEYEVAVIIGGVDDVEIYSGHLPSNYTSCADNVAIPPLPYQISWASSVFLENHGIFICGGIGYGIGYIPDCYKNHPNDTDGWEAVVNDNRLAVSGAAITPGVPGDQQSDSGFWILGGHDGHGVKETYIYKTDEPDNMTEGCPLPQRTSGHCAVTVNYNGVQNVLVIGGYGGSNIGDKVYIYCNDTRDPMCKEGSQDGWSWRETSSLKQTRVDHSCTVFNHTTKGQAVLVAGGQAVLVAGGYDGGEDRQSSEILFVEDCSNNSSSCEWQQAGHLLEAVEYSEMVTLGNEPVVFGGQSDQFGVEDTVLSSVQKYSWESGEYKWVELQNMSKPRYGHSVVSVPETFLCQYPPSPTTEPSPTEAPTVEPSSTVEPSPTEAPTEEPSPTEAPTVEPSPTEEPTEAPTEATTSEPSSTAEKSALMILILGQLLFLNSLR